MRNRAMCACILGSLLSGCNGGGGGQTSGGGATGMSFQATTSALGTITYSCDATSGITDYAGFAAACHDPSSPLQPSVLLANYHGSDVYTFGGVAQDAGGAPLSLVQFGTGDQGFSSAYEPYPQQPGPSCTVTIMGPPTLSKGDRVSGTFHCDNLSVQHFGGAGSGGYQPPTFVSADGSFDGVATP